jgi:hypothetical protein
MVDTLRHSCMGPQLHPGAGFEVQIHCTSDISSTRLRIQGFEVGGPECGGQGDKIKGLGFMCWG